MQNKSGGEAAMNIMVAKFLLENNVYKDCGMVRIPTVYYDQIMDALNEPEWISVTDRMPEERDSIFSKLKGTDKWKPAIFEKKSEDVRVVVVFEDGTRMVDHAHTIDGKWDVEKHPPKRTVTHWMPNPGLPEEGQ